MYLPDRELRALLPDLNFRTDEGSEPFDAATQIQPCSIDLRLSTRFWRQKRRSKFDLQRARLLEVQPRRHWKPIVLGDGEKITLRRGEMLLGRTYESFSIPPGYAGKLEGRSSYARLGLAVHCSADFINPGYTGHMPLQLINFGKSPITLMPKLPICQLIVVRLNSPSERLYGHDALSSKYVNDDGGPSYWWRDNLIKKLHESMGKRRVPESIQNQIFNLIGPREPELLERFEVAFDKIPISDTTNAMEILDIFSQQEDSARKRIQFFRGVALSIGPATLLGAALGTLFTLPWTLLHSIFWILTAVFLILAGYTHFFTDPPGEYLGKRELEEIERRQLENERVLSGRPPQ